MKKNTLIIILFTICINSLYTQNNNYVLKGDDYFKQRKYLEAVNSYKMALLKIKAPASFYLTEQIAKSYHGLNDYDNALLWYKNLMVFEKENETKPENIKTYGQLLMNFEQYDEAIITFNTYKKTTTNNDADKWINFCLWAKNNINQMAVAEIKKTNIEIGLKSMGLSFYGEGLVVAIPQKNDFTEETTYYDLAYIKKSTDETFENPILLEGDVNKKFYEAAPYTYDKGEKMFFTSNSSEVSTYKLNKKEKYQISSSGLNVLKLFYTEKINNKWGNISILPFNSNEYSCAFPVLSEDGLTLYFASDMPGGYGGFDLYKVTKEKNNEWSNPINLGRSINTPENEIYPYPNNSNLYFSSKGWAGFGGYDIYKVNINSTEKDTPENLGIPINSSKDDFSYITDIDGKMGYLSSNRDEKNGYDKIYFFKNIDSGTIKGLIYNKITKNKIPDVSIYLNKETIPVAVSDKDGLFNYLIQNNNSTIDILFENPWYETKIESFEKVNSAINGLKEVYLTPIMLYGKINNINNYEEPVKVKLFLKDENGNWIFEDEKEVMNNGDWSFHIRKDKEYKVEFFVGDEFSDKEIITRFDDSDKMRNDVIENLLDYELSFKNENKIDGYAVQIAAYRFPKNFKVEKYNNLASFKINNQGINDGIQRFLSEYFSNIEDARLLRKKMIQLGIKDTLLVAIKNNNRVAIIEPKELATTYPSSKL